MLDPLSGSACTDISLELTVITVAQPELSLFKMTAQTEQENRSARRINKQTIIQLVHNTARLQEDS